MGTPRHVTFGEPQSNDELFFHRQSEGLTAIIAAQNVQKLLLSGCTGFLDADVLYNAGCDVRDAIEIGAVEGPRMSTGGNALLTAVGGTAGRLIPEEGLRGYAQVVRSLYWACTLCDFQDNCYYFLVSSWKIHK